jgi:hypothetical protein
VPIGFAVDPAVPTGGLIYNTMNNTVWVNWNTAYATGSTTVPQYNPMFAGTTGTTIYLNDLVWISWNTTWTETQEQRAQREAAHAERERLHAEEMARLAAAQAERSRVRVAAKARAEELLLSLLTDEQVASYRDKGWFEVRGSKGGRWRIRNRGQAGNVDLMPEIGEEREATYCAHPPDHLPDADAYVAQMLHIVTDEEDFVRVANQHWRRPAAARVRVTVRGGAGHVAA